jgi:serine/threonine-protein kinase
MVHIGWLLAETGRRQEAEAEYRKALALDLKRADNKPLDAGFRGDLADRHTSLGILLKETGKPSEAEDEFRQALAIRRKLAEAEPGNPRWRRAVGMSLADLGDLDTVVGRLDAAVARFGESAVTHEQLVRDAPTSNDYRSGLAFALTGLGRAYHRSGRSAEAVEPLQRAVALREAIPPLSPETTFDLARGQALLAAATSVPGSSFSSAEGQGEARRAMATMRQAVAAGFHDLSRLDGEADFSALRGRSDFQLLMMDLEFPDDPFAAPR